ncbi:MAG: DUF359 domain-containing protein, partial [Candidatus Levyibacteriota bacterium]
FALSLSKKIVIGLTSDEYVSKSKVNPSTKLRTRSQKSKVGSGLIEGYEERKKTLEKFLREEEVTDRTSIVRIDDVYGITILPEQKIDALIVTEKTLEGAKQVNAKRKELGLLSLEVVIAPTLAADDGEIISSSRIRAGEISREGKVYVNPSWLGQKLFLPDNLRDELKKPFGELIYDEDFDNFGLVITVGDVTTEKFNSLSLNPKISVIDYNVARKKKFEKISELGFLGDEKIIRVKNLAGEINPELFLAIATSILEKGRVVIEILGEEDLAVLPAILTSPLGVVIYYGQPGKGVVRVEVTEEIKEKAYSLVSQFITRGH